MGFSQPPPIFSTHWTTAVSVTKIQVNLFSLPGGGVTGVLVETYLVSTPGVINEVWNHPGTGLQTGTFNYSTGQLVGIRVAWTIDGVKPCSPYSTESQQTIP